jgi:hypothetical protein
MRYLPTQGKAPHLLSSSRIQNGEWAKMGYYIDVKLPDLSEFKDGFPAVNVLFAGLGPADFKTRALMAAFLRLTGTAIRQYENARAIVQWLHSATHSAIPVGAFHDSSGYFEACITNMHRATQAMLALKRRPDIQMDVKAVLPKKIHFTQDTVEQRVREVRDAVQHFDELIFQGVPSPGVAIVLVADGYEENRGDDTFKVIDRLKIGNYEIRFDELCQWLREMAKCANALRSYGPPGTATSDET